MLCRGMLRKPVSQSALKHAISNRKMMKYHIAQTTSDDVCSNFVIYQGPVPGRRNKLNQI